MLPKYVWFVIVTFILFLIPILLVVGISYLNGFVDGVTKGSREGQVIGQKKTCDSLAHQYNWTVNVERDRVESKQITQTQANDVLAAEAAAYAYSCPWATPQNDIYYPQASPVPVAVNKSPAIPVAPKATKIPCPLTAAHCAARGY